jgi:hypothetical protein
VLVVTLAIVADVVSLIPDHMGEEAFPCGNTSSSCNSLGVG